MILSTYSQTSPFTPSSRIEPGPSNPYFGTFKNFDIPAFSSQYSPQLHGRITLCSYALKLIAQWIQIKQKNMLNRSHVFLTSLMVILVSLLFMYSGFLIALKVSQKDTSNDVLNSELIKHTADHVSYIPEFDPFSPYTASSAPSQRPTKIHNSRAQIVPQNQPSNRPLSASFQNSRRIRASTDPRFLNYRPYSRTAQNRIPSGVTKTRYVPNNPVMYVPTTNGQAPYSRKNINYSKRRYQKSIPSPSVPNRIFQTRYRSHPVNSRYQQRGRGVRSAQYNTQRTVKKPHNSRVRQRSNLNGLPKNSPLPQDFIPPALQ